MVIEGHGLLDSLGKVHVERSYALSCVESDVVKMSCYSIAAISGGYLSNEV